MKQILQFKTNQQLLPFFGVAFLLFIFMDISAQMSGTVWQDLSANGLVASAMTNANGTDSPSHKYSLTMLMDNMEYTLTVPTTNGGRNLPLVNTGKGSNTDINDSDANTVTGVATVLATTIPASGTNKHSFDFGYGPPPPCPPTRCGIIASTKN